MDFAGALVPELIQRAVELLVAKHDALRIQLHTDTDGLPRQTFDAALTVQVQRHDFCALADPQAASQALMHAQMARPYALSGEPLSRFFWSSSMTITTTSAFRPIT